MARAWKSGVPQKFRTERVEAYHARLHAWELARMEEARALARVETWVTSADPDDAAMRDAMAREAD